MASRQEDVSADSREAEIEGAILQSIHQLPATRRSAVTVLVVEDEWVYRNGRLSLLERSEDLSRHVRMVFAHNDREALAAIEKHDPVLVIEDVDLGSASKDGIEIVTMVRAKGFKGHICVHSNRFLAGDNRAALAAGADTVLPKPLGRAHFLKLLLASLPEISAVGDASVGAREASQKLSVAMIDDSVSMRVGWRMEIGKQTNFRSFASSGAFLDACDREELFLSNLKVVVTDYNFAPGDPHDGGTLARELRCRGYQGLIFPVPLARKATFACLPNSGNRKGGQGGRRQGFRPEGRRASDSAGPKVRKKRGVGKNVYTVYALCLVSEAYHDGASHCAFVLESSQTFHV